MPKGCDRVKEMIATILAIVCAFAMVSCNNSPAEQIDAVSNKSFSDFEGISVEISDLHISPDKTSLTVLWSNSTEYTAVYGDVYRIQRLEKDEWVDCSLGVNVFNMVGYLLMPNETADKEYDLTQQYDISQAGTYRFIADCSVETSDEHSTDCSVWAEFRVQ